MKNYIKTICQLPVSILLYTIVWIEYGLARCLKRLSNPILCPFASSLIERIDRETRPEKDICPTKDICDVRSNVSVFRDWLKSQDDAHVEVHRIYIEKEFGIPVGAKDKDPHLYAVCRPSREENIRRIAYSLCTMNTIELQYWFLAMRGLLQ